MVSHALGDGAKSLITFRVPVGVVVALEVIDVAHRQRERLRVAARPRLERLQIAIQLAPVAQAGQRIGQHFFLELAVIDRA